MTTYTRPPLRPATPADVPAITDLVQRAYAPWIAVIGREPRPMSADYEAALGVHRFDLIEADGRLVALIETERHEDHLLVVNIAVDPGRQGTGLGRRLLAHAEDLAAAAGLAALRLFTNARMERNIVLYERAGYRIETREMLETGAGVHMLKLLRAPPRRLLLPRIFAISLKPVPFFHSSKTEAFSSAVNVRLIQKTSATPCFHITVALTN